MIMLMFVYGCYILSESIYFTLVCFLYVLCTVLSLILNIAGKINFQTSRVIHLPVKFSRIPSDFLYEAVIRGTRCDKHFTHYCLKRGTLDVKSEIIFLS